MNDKWILRFLELARHISKWSKDPSTKVGCVVVGPDMEIRSTGFNGFPRGIKDDDRLNDRSKKYPIICHAEENAIMHAARIGVSLKDCTAFVTHPPCCRCARSIIQSGIKRVVFTNADMNSNWSDDIKTACDLFNEAGIQLTVDDKSINRKARSVKDIILDLTEFWGMSEFEVKDALRRLVLKIGS